MTKMNSGNLYQIKKEYKSNVAFTDVSNVTHFVFPKEDDVLLFLYVTMSYSGSNYYFLYDDMIICRHYAYDILDEFVII